MKKNEHQPFVVNESISGKNEGMKSTDVGLNPEFVGQDDRRAEDIYIGQVVNNKEEALTLYQAHAYRMGFNVRIGKQAFYVVTKNIRMKGFYCSKEGYKNNEPYVETSYSRPDSRTGCKAMVQFMVDTAGLWKITHLVKEHNHELVKPEHRHLMPSMRNISKAKGDLIKSMVNAGISTNQVYRYLSEEAGGYDKVGGISKDFYNFVNNKRLKLIEVGDGQSLVNHLQSRQAEDPLFYYSIQFDEELRLTNVFWRDGRSRLDYDCFGDVVMFDTTYRTNKYDLVCAPFVGVNNHWQNVMFGCSFLLRESSKSFIWLFEKFLESMGNSAPKTIMTDQDGAMAIAIEKVMPNTRHRLCLWHISKNAPSHFGSLNS